MRKMEINSRAISRIVFEIEGKNNQELMRETITDRDITMKHLESNYMLQFDVAELFNEKKKTFDTIYNNNEVSYATITCYFSNKRMKTRHIVYTNMIGLYTEYRVVFY